MGYLVALRGRWMFISSSLLILVVGGLGVWVFGRAAYHIGASGLVFGYFGFLVAIGIYGMFQLRVTGNLTGDFSDDDPVYVDIKFIEEKFKGVMPLEIVIETEKDGGVTKLSTLKKIDELTRFSIETIKSLKR